MLSVVRVSLFVVFLATVLGVVAAESPSAHVDPSALVREIEAHQSADFLFGSLENTYYAVDGLRTLKASVKGSEKICAEAFSALVPDASASDLHYASGLLRLLQCKGKAPPDLSRALLLLFREDSASLETYYHATMAVSNLLAQKLITFDVTELSTVLSKVEALTGIDGTISNTSSDSEGSIYYTGLGYQIAQAVLELRENNEDLVEQVERIIESADSLLEEYSEMGQGLAYVDRGDSRTALVTTYSLYKGAVPLASLGGYVLHPSVASGLAEYFVTAVRRSLEDIDATIGFLSLLTSDNALPNPVVVSLLDTALSLSKQSSTVRVRVSDVFGGSVGDVNVFLVSAHLQNDLDSTIVHNQELQNDGNSSTDFLLNLSANKPEQGFYSLEFSVNEKSSKFRVTAIRTLKVLGSISIPSVQMDVMDTADKSIEHSLTAVSERPFDHVSTSLFFTLSLKFSVRNKINNRPVRVQQTFLRISDARNEVVIPAVASDSGDYVATANLKDVGQSLLFHSNDYSLELIVGDALIDNPLVWNLGSIYITFPPTMEIDGSTPFEPKPDIHHIFRTPDKRPPEQLSMLFSLAVMAPTLILFLGLLGMKVQFTLPSGAAFLPTILFLACIVLTFTLYGWFWYELNMFQTLTYVGMVSVGTVVFGNRALRARAAKRTSRKEKDE